MWTGIPRQPHRRRGARALAPDGGGAARAHRRPGRGDHTPSQGGAPRARRSQGPEAPDRLVHLPRPDRRRQDRAGQDAGRVHVRQRRRPDQDRHVGVHGAPQRRATGRRASRLRRLRGRRPAHRGRPAQELLGDPARRDREGPPRSLQHAAPDPGRRPPVGRQGAQGRLPQHDHHHDLQRRRAADQARHRASASRSRATAPGAEQASTTRCATRCSAS